MKRIIIIREIFLKTIPFGIVQKNLRAIPTHIIG